LEEKDNCKNSTYYVPYARWTTYSYKDENKNNSIRLYGGCKYPSEIQNILGN